MAGKKVRVEGVDLSSATDIAQYLGREILRSVDQPNLLQYKPHVKQKKFHQSPKRIRLYIGGNRSGKSTGGVVEDLWWLKKAHPYMRLPIADSEPCRGRVVAVDFINGIDKIILPQFAQWTPKSMLIDGSWVQSYDKAHKVLNFSNGSFVEFMSYDQDLDKFAGTSRHFIHFDEEPPQPIYIENYARIVDTGGHLWITMTPVEGMTWVFDTIYEPGILGSELIDVIIVDMTDNPYLNKQAIQEFIDGLTEQERDARIHGKFVQLGGLIYKGFDPRPGGTHVIRGRWHPTPGDGWEVGLGLDHGLSNPTAVGFHAFNHEGDIITFDEHYLSGAVVEEHALLIKQKLHAYGYSPGAVEMKIADPSIKNRDPITGTSIQQEYAKHGIFWSLGNNDVPAGIIRVTGFMKPRGPKAQPKWRVTENCKYHIKEHGRYRWKTYESKAKNWENNSFEEPHKKDDHTCDELRYFIMARPDITSAKAPKDPPFMRVEIEASKASRASGAMYAGRDEREMIEYEEGVYAQGYNTIPGGGTEFDEHLGGFW